MAVQEAGYQFDVEEAVRHLRAADPVLARIVGAVGPFAMAIRPDPYQMLVRAIQYQQITGRAAAAIERRFHELYGGAPPEPAALLATPDEALRGAGLSRQKIAYLRDLAARALDGTLDTSDLHRLPDEEVIRRVTLVKGIGRWTAEMLLMFCLGRPDVLPVGDLGLRRGVQRAYGLPDLPAADELTRLAEPWRPYRSVATWYLWQSVRMTLPEG
ncbi:MAG TPA: DNA-3-methyladenine glycosylase [Dehalococcoidia bacterium]